MLNIKRGFSFGKIFKRHPRYKIEVPKLSGVISKKTSRFVKGP